MGQEIEKKYLIREDGINYMAKLLLETYASVDVLKEEVIQNGKVIRQGYLQLDLGLELSKLLDMSVNFEVNEARLRNEGKKFYFTIKGFGSLTRNELEVEIEESFFDEFWAKTEGKRIEKIRLKKLFEELILEIDVYTDRDLIIAEVEVATAQDAEKICSFGKDVTLDYKFKNKNLAG
jgi:CYTH domain-containing protein